MVIIIYKKINIKKVKRCRDGMSKSMHIRYIGMKRGGGFANMLTFAFVHHPCFHTFCNSMPSLYLFPFLFLYFFDVNLSYS